MPLSRSGRRRTQIVLGSTGSDALAPAVRTCITEPMHRYIGPVFEQPTYIVLELPPSTGDRVLDIRRRYDQRLADFPVEITVAGSSGLGSISQNQDARAVFTSLASIADDYLPITTRFVGISCFETGPVVWLQPAESAPFVALQQSLKASEIQFLPHKFPYTPHCSLCTSNLDSGAKNALFAEKFPQEPFELLTLALYTVVDGKPRLVRRFKSRCGPYKSLKPDPLPGSA